MDFREFEVIVLYINRESSLNVINTIFKVTTGPEPGERIMWGLESYFSINKQRVMEAATAADFGLL